MFVPSRSNNFQISRTLLSQNNTY